MSQDESSPSVIVIPESQKKKVSVVDSAMSPRKDMDIEVKNESEIAIKMIKGSMVKQNAQNEIQNKAGINQEFSSISLQDEPISLIEQKMKIKQTSSLLFEDLPEVFREYCEVTDQWISKDQDINCLEEKMALLTLLKSCSQVAINSDENEEIENEFKSNSRKAKPELEKLLDQFRIIYDLKTNKQRSLSWKFEFDQLKKVQTIFERKGQINIEAVSHSYISEKLSYSNLQTLKGQSWLNDEVVNAYVRLIGRASSDNVVLLNSFFYPEVAKKSPLNKLKRIMAKNKAGYESGYILIPMNVGGNHWTFTEIDNEKGIIYYYDSLSNHTNSNYLIAQPFAELMENLQKEDGILETNRKPYKVIEGKTGLQQNCYDCGVFMLQGIYLRAKRINGLNLWLDQNDTLFYRYLITFQLLTGKIDTTPTPSI